MTFISAMALIGFILFFACVILICIALILEIKDKEQMRQIEEITKQYKLKQ